MINIKRIIYSVKLAQRLISEGFKVISADLNYEDNSKLVFIFKFDSSSMNEFQEVIQNYKDERVEENEEN